MKPNIICIMADDMGYGDLGCYGAERIRTPNMDRIAAEGMRFTDAHSSSAVCTPSRYSVLTGRYCWRTRHKKHVIGGFDPPLIEKERITVASLLGKHGYATAAVGKWHVGLGWQTKEGREFQAGVWEDDGTADYSKPLTDSPLDHGFDYHFSIAGSLDMPPYCFIENGRTVGIPTEEKAPMNPQQKKGFMTPGWRDEDVDSNFADRAVAWLEKTHEESPEKPFFLYLTPSAPHRPCMPPDFMRGKSQAGPRGDMVMVVDWVVGRILDTLDRLGVADNTLLIVTSDNGAQPCDVDGNTHGHKSCGELRGFKSHIWEGGHRVPYIVRWPGKVKEGTVCDAFVGLFDLITTCADIVGDKLPEDAAEDAVSILPVILGEEGAGGRSTMVHHSVDGTFAVRDGKWKYVDGAGCCGFPSIHARESEKDGPTQLYDMKDDWRETTNRAGKRSEIAGQLKELLECIKREPRSFPIME